MEQCSSPPMRSEGWEGADAERAFSGGGALGAGTVYFYSTPAAIVTAVAVTSTLTLEGGRVFASDDAAATVTAASTVADAGIEGLPPRRVSAHDASSMLEKGNRNKNGTKDIGIQA
jgi:hypothetical protein